jgi:hypothetical protein
LSSIPLGLRRSRLFESVPEDGEIRAIHAAKVAATALFGIDYMRRVVALRIESRGERQNVGGAKLNTERTALAPLDVDGDGAFSQVDLPVNNFGATGVPTYL